LTIDRIIQKNILNDGQDSSILCFTTDVCFDEMIYKNRNQKTKFDFKFQFDLNSQTTRP